MGKHHRTLEKGRATGDGQPCSSGTPPGRDGDSKCLGWRENRREQEEGAAGRCLNGNVYPWGPLTSSEDKMKDRRKGREGMKEGEKHRVVSLSLSHVTIIQHTLQKVMSPFLHLLIHNGVLEYAFCVCGSWDSLYCLTYSSATQNWTDHFQDEN